MAKLLRLISLLFINIPLLAQRPATPTPPVCGNPDLSQAERQSLSREAEFAIQMKRSTGAVTAGITYVPIRPHIFRRSNGTGGMTLDKLNNVMAIANSYYLNNGSGIQFYFCGTAPDYIDNDVLFNSYSSAVESSINGRDATNALNQYYVNTFTPAIGGYAYFPSNSIVSTRSFILNGSDEDDLGNRLLPHELGHNFNLFHTFGNNLSGTTELVTRGRGANCSTDGDMLCDTPADPYGILEGLTGYKNGCQTYIGTLTDIQGNAYTPSITNIMSYYFPCEHDFTQGQYGRMQAGLALRQSHKAYSLDCRATPVTAPSDLAATINDGAVVLTWRDNAPNEMGYFIERSTSPQSGFVPIGGVAPDTKTFRDLKVAALTTYYYRVRPSNATTTGVSQTVTIRTGSCRPTYGAVGCSDGDGLAKLVLNGITLSQDSGCSPGGYRASGATSTTVTAGQSYTVTGNFINALYRQGVSVWADLNRNGVYESDRNEKLYQTPSPLAGQFTGTITLPASLTVGSLSLRVIVAYDELPLEPCGQYKYGETEDYEITVATPSPIEQPTASADLSLLMRVSDRIVDIGQPVSYSLTIRNSGPADATGISWQNRLPASMSFVSGEAGVVNSSTAVSGHNLSLANGASATFVYQLRALQQGTHINAAQILSCNQPDPDSKPGSGTGDGQDDIGLADIRTMLHAGALHLSPNHNQEPLPPVASNQPAPHPTKPDLSLMMKVSCRTFKVGSPVTFSLTVSNSGSQVATNVVVHDTLRGLTLLAFPTGMNVIATGKGYTVIEGVIISLAAGNSDQLVFTATAMTPGDIENAAQIWSSNQPDADSTHGSTILTDHDLNGEDDVSWVNLRVLL